jgi:deoxyribose-phosphate aldolase
VQAAWLLRAVSCIDLTTLSGDDTPANTARLALKAARPVRMDLLQVRENLNLVIQSLYYADFGVNGLRELAIEHGKDFYLSHLLGD